jgi:hypothetical protein
MVQGPEGILYRLLNIMLDYFYKLQARGLYYKTVIYRFS